MKKIAFFATESFAGRQLANKLKKFFTDKPVEFEIINDRELTNIYQKNDLQKKYSPRQLAGLIFMSSVFEMDWIIVDLTRESRVKTNYDIIGELPKSVSYITIVSRNYLPINMYSIQKGGYPTYTQGEFTNDEIFAFVNKYYNENKDVNIKRDPKFTTENIFTNPGLLNDFYKEQINQNNRRSEKTLSIFISYRSKYEYLNKDNNPGKFKLSVSELAEKINSGKINEIDVALAETHKYNVLASRIKEGDLVYSRELLSKSRAWQIVSYIDRYYIDHTDELWIYASSDYWSSWWTRGEVLAFIYSLLTKSTDLNRKRKILRIYDPKENKIIRSFTEEEILGHITFDKDKFIAGYTRYFSNTNIDTMGPETIKSLKTMKNSPGMAKEIIESLLSFDKDNYETMKTVFMQLRDMDDTQFQEISSVDDYGMLNMAKMMRTWSDTDIDLYLNAYANMAERIKAYKIKNPAATIEELNSQIVSLQFGDLGISMEKSLDTSITEIVKQGQSEEYLSHEVFDDDFETKLYVFEPSIKDQPFSLNFDSKLLDSFFKITATNDLHNPFLVGEEKGIVILNGKKKRLKTEKPRYLFVPKRFGGLFDWSANHDCLDIIPVKVVKA